MKVQISRFSPHQNAKVFAILFAVSSLVFVIPFMLFGLASAPKHQGPSFFLVVLFPLLYLVIGYVMVAVSCWFYNIMFSYTGGIEFEQQTSDA